MGSPLREVPLYSYVMLRGMWRANRPDTRGHVAPEGEGLCRPYTLISHDITDLCHVIDL